MAEVEGNLGWGKKLLLYFPEQTFLPFSQKLNKVNQEMKLLIFQKYINFKWEIETKHTSAVERKSFN